MSVQEIDCKDYVDPEGKYESLEKYGKDLTAMAREVKLDPVIRRDDEIRKCMQILSRRSKNNPVLIGEPCVGNTAISKGLAQRIVQGDVPQALMLISLDMGALVAGAKYHGEFKDRLKAVLKEVTESDGQIILFINEIHTVVGAGATNGAMNAGDLLKPMLGCGELRCIVFIDYDLRTSRFFTRDVLIRTPYGCTLVKGRTQIKKDRPATIQRGLGPKWGILCAMHVTLIFQQLFCSLS